MTELPTSIVTTDTGCFIRGDFKQCDPALTMLFSYCIYYDILYLANTQYSISSYHMRTMPRCTLIFCRRLNPEVTRGAFKSPHHSRGGVPLEPGDHCRIDVFTT